MGDFAEIGERELKRENAWAPKIFQKEMNLGDWGQPERPPEISGWKGVFLACNYRDTEYCWGFNRRVKTMIFHSPGGAEWKFLGFSANEKESFPFRGWDDGVRRFCRKEQIEQDLEQFVSLANQIYSYEGDFAFELMQDFETGEEWINVTISIEHGAGELIEQEKAFLAEWTRKPWPKVSQIRIDYNFLE